MYDKKVYKLLSTIQPITIKQTTISLTSNHWNIKYTMAYVDWNPGSVYLYFLAVNT